MNSTFNEKIKVDLGPVQKTLFMPLWARAKETLKDKPLLTDIAALEIVRKTDFDFSRLSDHLQELSIMSWIARCKRYDEVIRDFIGRNPGCTVVNLGCGMDTTYERISDPDVLWYDLDLPDVIDLKRKFIPESEKRKYIAKSFLDRSWLNNMHPNNRLLFISAGVFPYIEEEKMKDFFGFIASTFPGAELFFDVTSKHGIKAANSIISKSGLDEHSFMKWALDNPHDLLKWDKKLNLLNVYYTYKINGLGLSPRNRILAAISDILKIQYMMHMKVRG